MPSSHPGYKFFLDSCADEIIQIDKYNPSNIPSTYPEYPLIESDPNMAQVCQDW